MSLRSPFVRSVGVAIVAVWPVAMAAACEVVLREHRSERELWRGALDVQAPRLALTFVHSVLGTPVEDHYRLQQGRWVLVAERFEGLGYGLPHQAGPGEQLVRDGEGWWLRLQRPVWPLVVRPVQQVRLLRPGADPLELAALSQQAIELLPQGCGSEPSAARRELAP